MFSKGSALRNIDGGSIVLKKFSDFIYAAEQEEFLKTQHRCLQEKSGRQQLFRPCKPSTCALPKINDLGPWHIFPVAFEPEK